MTLLHSPQLIQAPLTSQEDPENCTKIPEGPATYFHVPIKESKVHVEGSHHDVVLLGLFHQAQVLVGAVRGENHEPVYFS